MNLDLMVVSKYQKVEKDQSILYVLEKLIEELSNGFVVVDYWEGDLCAIGISASYSTNTLVYISTFNQLPNKYYYECEIIEGKNAMEIGDYTVVSKGQAEDFIALLKILNYHLYQS